MPGVPHVLSVTAQPLQKRFVFTARTGGATESRALVLPGSGEIRDGGWDVRVENTPAICPGSPAERVRTEIDARFGDVRVNQNALPPQE